MSGAEPGADDIGPPRFDDYPYGIVLLPKGQTLDALNSTPGMSALFLVDRGCGFDVLNGSDLAAYVNKQVAVLILSETTNDLRPFLRRLNEFSDRGYDLMVMR